MKHRCDDNCPACYQAGYDTGYDVAIKTLVGNIQKLQDKVKELEKEEGE